VIGRGLIVAKLKHLSRVYLATISPGDRLFPRRHVYQATDFIKKMEKKLGFFRVLFSDSFFTVNLPDTKTLILEERTMKIKKLQLLKY
jgi:hypothetical protein